MNANEATIYTLLSALEAALMQVPSGEVTFFCDINEQRFKDSPVKISKALAPDNTSDPHGRYFKAKVFKGFRMVKRGDYDGIQCLRCQQTSFHPQDIKQKFCAKCNIFHTDEEIKERSSSNGRLIDLT